MNNHFNTVPMNQSHQHSPTSTFLREDELILSSMLTKSSRHEAFADSETSKAPSLVNGKIRKSLVGFDPLLGEGSNSSGNGNTSAPTPTPTPTPTTAATRPNETGLSSSQHSPPRRRSGRPPLGAKSHRQSRSLGSCDLNDIFTSGELDDLDDILNSGPRGRIASVDAANSPLMGTKAMIAGSFRRRPTVPRRQTGGSTMPDLPLFSGKEPKTPDLSPQQPNRRLSINLSPFSVGGNSKSRSPTRSPPVTPTLTHSPAPDNNPNMPFLAKPSPTSFLTDNTSFRSSEQNPAPHQVEILSSSVAVASSKLCAFLDFYRTVDMSFELGLLVGVPRKALNEFVTLGMPLSGLKPSHQPIVRALLNCGESITVEGYHADESEVAIFSSQALNQLIVVYRGNDVEQAKPVQSKQSKTCGEANNFHSDHPLTVYPPFRDAYVRTESVVCKRLDQLTDADPFTDVIFCGHSFGGAMSVCAALRYSTMRPMTRVSCCALGAPKVGALDFKRTANTLSNLKVFRVEMSGDQAVQVPTDSSGIKWEHAGHTLAINQSAKTLKAYRFDKNKPAISNPAAAKNMFAKKVDRSSRCYAEALEQFADKWVTQYSGEAASKAAAKGMKHEVRKMVRAVSIGKR